jgi:hypothetical protein
MKLTTLSIAAGYPIVVPGRAAYRVTKKPFDLVMFFAVRSSKLLTTKSETTEGLTASGEKFKQRSFRPWTSNA